MEKRLRDGWIPAFLFPFPFRARATEKRFAADGEGSWLRSYVRDSRPLTSSRNESIDREVIFGNLSNLRPYLSPHPIVTWIRLVFLSFSLLSWPDPWCSRRLALNSHIGFLCLISSPTQSAILGFSFFISGGLSRSSIKRKPKVKRETKKITTT